MVTYKVTISDEAKAALREIHSWFKENESDLIADKVRDGLVEAIEGLSKMPTQHGLALEIENDQIIYRRILKWSYKIIFTIDEDEIEVLVVDIVHSKRNPKLLQEKFGS